MSQGEYIEQVRSLGNGDVEQFEQVRQPAFVRGNVYLNGAKHFDREDAAVEAGVSPAVCITENGGEVFLELELPEGSLSGDTEIISSKTLGTVRIVSQRFEHPDGTALWLHRDMVGAKRGTHPVAGPVEGLYPGKNKVLIWTRPNNKT